MSAIGPQPDGSYVPCPDCRAVPKPPLDDDCPGVAIPLMPGATIHKSTCPRVPQVSQETRDRIIEMDRVRRRGAAEARNFWIG